MFTSNCWKAEPTSRNKALMRDVVDAVVKNANVSKESVHVILNEISKQHLTKNGEFIGEKA
jgi:4-oxalocrotonate tautomerase